MTDNPHRIKLWDLPIRLFHWLLAVLVLAAVITGKVGGSAIVWHGRIGLAILGLIAFRMVWGLVGSTHARFASFFPTPASIAAYLRGQWHGLGHNPLGALSVLGLLTLLTAQVSTGLFANDDIAFRGPLSDLITKDNSDALSTYHRLIIKGLLAMILLHLGAIAFYTHVKKDSLVKPMISGWKDIDPNHATPFSPLHYRGGGPIALICALAFASFAVYAGSGAWLPPPPVAQPAATQKTPAW